MGETMDLEEVIAEKVMVGDALGIRELTEKVRKEAIPPQAILNDGFVLAMEAVGRRYEEGEYHIRDMPVVPPRDEGRHRGTIPLLGVRAGRTAGTGHLRRAGG